MTNPPQMHSSTEEAAPCRPGQTDFLPSANSQGQLSVMLSSDSSNPNMSPDTATAAKAAVAAAAVASSFPYHTLYMDPVTAATMFYQQHHQHHQLPHAGPPTHATSPTHMTHVTPPHPHSHVHAHVHANINAPLSAQFPLSLPPHSKQSLPGQGTLGIHPTITATYTQPSTIADESHFGSAHVPAQTQTLLEAPAQPSSTEVIPHPGTSCQTQDHQQLHHKASSPPNDISTHPYYIHDQTSVTALALRQMQLAHHLQMYHPHQAQHAPLSQSQSESHSLQFRQSQLHLHSTSKPSILQAHLPTQQQFAQGHMTELLATGHSKLSSDPQLGLMNQFRSTTTGPQLSQGATHAIPPEMIHNSQAYSQGILTKTESSLNSNHIYEAQASGLFTSPAVGMATSHSTIDALSKSLYGGAMTGLPVVPDTQMESAYRIGRYTPAERRMRLERYREKRATRNYNRRVKYDCRKMIADKRVRVQGRFVKREEEVALVAAASGDNIEVPDDYDMDLNGDARSPERGGGTSVTSDEARPLHRTLQGDVDDDDDDDEDVDNDNGDEPMLQSFIKRAPQTELGMNGVR